MNVFKSKIDNWLLFFLVLSIIACMLGASAMLDEGGGVNYALAAFVLVVGAGLPLWVLLSTKYIVENEHLKIISGPFSWDIPVKSITSIKETQDAVASPALSLDRLEINYGEDKTILISPAEKEAFIEQVAHDKLSVIGVYFKKPSADKKPKSSSKKATKKAKNMDGKI